MIRSRVAFLNLSRNLRRTTLTLALMIIGTAGLIVNTGLITFIFDGLRDDAIYGRFGHVQLYKSGYLVNQKHSARDYWLQSQEYDELCARLRTFKEVKAVTAESSLPVFLIAGKRTAAAVALGVIPADLSSLSGSQLKEGSEKLTDSESFSDTLIGRGLAERMALHVGDILTVTAIGSSNSYTALDIRVAGIFEEGFRDYDDWSMKLPLSAVQRLAGKNGVEKVFVILDSTADVNRFTSAFSGSLAREGVSFDMTTWRQLADFYRQVVAMFGKELDVIKWIIQAVALFGIVISLAMAFSERQREMATLLALGMSRVKLACLFLEECFWLGVLAAIFGAIAGIVLGKLISIVGIPMPAPPGSTRAFTARVQFLPLNVLYYSSLTLLVTLLAAVVPAVWISKLRIAEALRPNEG